MATIVTRTAKGSALTITELDANFTNLNTAKIETETNDLTAAVTWANVPDANITQSSVTQHQAALSITESQISDLGSYITASSTDTLTNKTLTTPVISSISNTGTLTLPTTTGTVALTSDIPTAVSSLTNDSGYLTSFTETNDLSAAVTWANVPDANITQSSVTQHQAALSITESQISDLSHTTSLPFASITSTPTTLSGYGITDGYANSDVDTHLNTSTATTGQVLSWDGADYDWITGGGGGGISNVVEDTTPQLGGALDVNGNAITSVSNGDIAITPNGTGNTLVTNLKLADSFDTNNQTITAATQFVVSSSKYYFRNTTGNNFLLESDTTGKGVVLRAPASMAADLALTLPSADGTNGQVLTTNGSGVLSFTTVSGGGGGGDVVDDTTPQLGGDLDVNGNSIISAAASNGDIELAPDGTGNIKVTMASSNAIATDADNSARGTYYVIGSPSLNTGFYGSNTTTAAFINWRNRSVDASAGRYYIESIGRDIKFNNANSTISSSNARFRTNHMQYAIDVNGMTYLDGDRAGRGIIGIRNNFNVTNSNETYGATVERAAAIENQLYFQAGFDNEYSAVSNPQDLTIDHGSVYAARVGVESAGSASVNITGDVSVWHTHRDSRDASNGNFNVSSGALFYNVKNDMPHYVEKFGSVGYYSELSYEETHSASGTYTVDYNNGNTQIVTLSDNITSFTMSNFPGDNNASGTPMIGSVTLFLKQDGTGGRTVSFTAGAGETFKIANGITTVDSGAGNYTVVSVMNVDGTYLWTISGNYI